MCFLPTPQYASKNLLPSVCGFLDRLRGDPPAPTSLGGVTPEDAAVWAVQDAMIERLPKVGGAS